MHSRTEPLAQGLTDWTLILCVPLKLPAIMQAPLDRYSQTSSPSIERDKWKSAPVVNSSLVDDPTTWQPGFDLPRCYLALLNCFRYNQDHSASCRKKWGPAATDMSRCGKCHTMSHIVNSCPQSKLEGAAVNAFS